jgi:hypothetical protein
MTCPYLNFLKPFIRPAFMCAPNSIVHLTLHITLQIHNVQNDGDLMANYNSNLLSLYYHQYDDYHGTKTTKSRVIPQKMDDSWQPLDVISFFFY